MNAIPIRPFGRRRVWAPTATEATAFDRLAIQDHGIPQATLMECAGRSAAQVLEQMFPRGDVVAFIGTGNNGGDGLVLLRTLRAWGRPVSAILVGDQDDREDLMHGWDVPLRGDEDLLAGSGKSCEVVGRAEIVVDGILGTGINGAPRSRQARAIQTINKSERPVFALDTPSGVDGNTGRIEGDAVTAHVTISFGWPKLGTLLQPGRAKVGRLIAVEIGFPSVEKEVFRAMAITPAWFVEALPAREPDTHKSRVGSLLLVAGSTGMAGAAVMAARGALRAGVGLLRIVSAPDNRSIVQGAVPEAIFVAGDDQEALREAAHASCAMALGPGLGDGDEVSKLLVSVLEATGGLPAVLDADALNLAASGAGPTLEEWAVERPVLITPHLGEMQRLSQMEVSNIEMDRVLAARVLADLAGVTVLLKGLPSIVVTPTGTCYVDTVGTSDLAAGGMGDVLTGVAGSLLAQGVAPSQAGALALYLTGRAARRTEMGPSLTPSDVIDEIAAVRTEQGSGETDLSLPFILFDQDAAR